jgi:hypothetical protein
MATDMPMKPMTRGERRYKTAKVKARRKREYSMHHSRPCDCPSCWAREGKAMSNRRAPVGQRPWESIHDDDLLEIV